MKRGAHRASRRLRWRIAGATAVGSLILGSASTAFAYLMVPARGDGVARAATLGRPHLQASSSGNSVTLSISPPHSGPVPSGYRLEWAPGGNGAGGTCRVQMTAGTCSFTGVPSGRYRYTVLSTLGTSWQSRPATEDVAVRCSNDGSGELTADTSDAEQHTARFVYTAAPGGTTDGALSIVVPPGWNLPSARPGSAGDVTASTGYVSVTGDTISVSGLTLIGGDRATITVIYGDATPGEAGGPAPAGHPTAAWPAFERSTPGGTLTALGSSPSIPLQPAPEGTGRPPVPNGITVQTSGRGTAAPPP